MGVVGFGFITTYATSAYHH